MGGRRRVQQCAGPVGHGRAHPCGDRGACQIVSLLVLAECMPPKCSGSFGRGVHESTHELYYLLLHAFLSVCVCVCECVCVCVCVCVVPIALSIGFHRVGQPLLPPAGLQTLKGMRMGARCMVVARRSLPWILRRRRRTCLSCHLQPRTQSLGATLSCLHDSQVRGEASMLEQNMRICVDNMRV